MCSSQLSVSSLSLSVGLPTMYLLHLKKVKELKSYARHILGSDGIFAFPTIAPLYTIAQLLDDPIALNTNIGYTLISPIYWISRHCLFLLIFMKMACHLGLL